MRTETLNELPPKKANETLLFRRATVPSSHGLANMIPSCWSLGSNGFGPELHQLFLIAM